jgi:hypothetical protein
MAEPVPEIMDTPVDPRFLDLALVGGEWSASHPFYFSPGERAPVPTG